jgi:hypothetical protein
MQQAKKCNHVLTFTRRKPKKTSDLMSVCGKLFGDFWTATAITAGQVLLEKKGR